MKTYNLFISHSWTYTDAYEKLVNLLNKRQYFVQKLFGPKDDPIHNARTDAQLRAAIRNQMIPCHGSDHGRLHV